MAEHQRGRLARHAHPPVRRAVPDRAELDLEVRGHVRDQARDAGGLVAEAHEEWQPVLGRHLRCEPGAQVLGVTKRPAGHVLPHRLVAGGDRVQRVDIAIEHERLERDAGATQDDGARASSAACRDAPGPRGVHGQILARARGGCLASGVFRNALVCLLVLVGSVAVADDTSATDKLRILYSTRFTFTDDGLPLVTVEIMGDKHEVKLHARSGVMVRPDGAGGSAIEADGATAGRSPSRTQSRRRSRSGPSSRRSGPMTRPASTRRSRGGRTAASIRARSRSAPCSARAAK